MKPPLAFTQARELAQRNTWCGEICRPLKMGQNTTPLPLRHGGSQLQGFCASCSRLCKVAHSLGGREQAGCVSPPSAGSVRVDEGGKLTH